jgi:hypothetical protein
MTRTGLILFTVAIGSALAPGAFADGWNTLAKNSERDGYSADLGPGRTVITCWRT